MKRASNAHTRRTYASEQQTLNMGAAVLVTITDSLINRTLFLPKDLPIATLNHKQGIDRSLE